MSRWYSDTTQIAWACAMLADGHKFSHACEFKAVRGWRLAAIIHILIHGYGWPVLHEDRKNGVRFYFLKPDTNAMRLKHPKSYRDYLIKQGLFDSKEKGDATPPSKSDSNNPNPEDND
ncbi:MAG: hypothetical protein ACK4VI_08775 [Alphaproteobacteria bacterium]